MNFIFTAFEGEPFLAFLLVFIVVLLTLGGLLIILPAAGVDLGDIVKKIFGGWDASKEPKEVIKPISRERQRELLMEYCRGISITSVHDSERKFNIMCTQILEDNPEICTIDELMIELDKIDKNLFKEN